MHASRARSIVRPTWRRSGRDPTRSATAAVIVALLVATAAARESDVLDAPISALWTAVPLRTWADRATTLAGRPVVADRRLDPDVAISRDCRDEPLGAVLAAAAGSAGAAVEPLRSWIRLAPAAVAGRAAHGERTRDGEIAALPAAARTALAARRPWSWPDGTRPRDLVSAAVTEAGLAVVGIEAVPHDHLPAAALPPLALAERLDLVLAHYDLRVAWSAVAGRVQGTITPLEAAPAPAPAGNDRRGPTAGPRGPRPGGTERFTLRLEAPLDEALAALAARLGLYLEIDRGSLAARGILPGEIVRAAVTDATREQLLDAAVGPLRLRWRIEGRRLCVDAPPP
jgi:hypothetical protein